ISPITSTGARHAIGLNAVGIYEAFCADLPNRFDIKDATGNDLTNLFTLRSSSENKKAVFGAFFDLQKIKKCCSDRGLKFMYRITYCDQFTIRLSGLVIEHGD